MILDDILNISIFFVILLALFMFFNYNKENFVQSKNKIKFLQPENKIKFKKKDCDVLPNFNCKNNIIFN